MRLEKEVNRQEQHRPKDSLPGSQSKNHLGWVQKTSQYSKECLMLHNMTSHVDHHFLAILHYYNVIQQKLNWESLKLLTALELELEILILILILMVHHHLLHLLFPSGSGFHFLPSLSGLKSHKASQPYGSLKKRLTKILRIKLLVPAAWSSRSSNLHMRMV